MSERDRKKNSSRLLTVQDDIDDNPQRPNGIKKMSYESRSCSSISNRISEKVERKKKKPESLEGIPVKIDENHNDNF